MIALVTGKVDLKEGKSGVAGFEKVSATSSAISPATVTVVADDKKTFDVAMGETVCRACGADAAGEDICPKCGSDRTKNMSPAYHVYSIAHVRGGTDLTMSNNVLLVNHEIGHSDVAPVNGLYHGALKAVLVKTFEDAWKDAGRDPPPWWSREAHDPAQMLNLMEDQLINYLKVMSSKVREWFGDAYATEMLKFYIADKDHPEHANDFDDELVGIIDMHFRLNRAYALSKLGMSAERDKVLTVSDPEENARFRLLYEWFYKTVDSADDAMKGPNIESLVSQWAWFVCVKGIGPAGREVSFGMEHPTSLFRADMKKKKYTDADVDVIIHKTKDLMTWLDDKEAKQLEHEIDDVLISLVSQI